MVHEEERKEGEKDQERERKRERARKEVLLIARNKLYSCVRNWYKDFCQKKKEPLHSRKLIPSKKGITF